MVENNQTCVSGMIAAFFTGAMLGAGLAFLFSPVTGKEARHSIVHQFEELKEKVKDLEKKMHKSGPAAAVETTDEEQLGI